MDSKNTFGDLDELGSLSLLSEPGQIDLVQNDSELFPGRTQLPSFGACYHLSYITHFLTPFFSLYLK